MGMCQVTTAEGSWRCRRCRPSRKFPFTQFTNCSACCRRASAGKCKVAQLPRDLAVHVKVGDDYKMVCILPAWEIKRLAPTVRQQLAAALLPSSSLAFTPPPSSALFPFCRLKGEHGRKTTETKAHKSCIDNAQAD